MKSSFYISNFIISYDSSTLVTTYNKVIFTNEAAFSNKYSTTAMCKHVYTLYYPITLVQLFGYASIHYNQTKHIHNFRFTCTGNASKILPS